MEESSDLVSYTVDGKSYAFSAAGSGVFAFGKDELLSNAVNDVTYQQVWYERGFTEQNFLNQTEFDSLKEGIRISVARIISEETGNNDLECFELENYHHFVKDEDCHKRVVARTRDLFPEDFHFPIYKFLPRFEEILGFGLTDIFEALGLKMHVIIRINRPFSKDFNPPHKDVYEGYDALHYVPRFLNLWIPIAGVTAASSLPLSAGSHLINEQFILRTFQGGVVEGNPYRVRLVKSWGGRTDLQRSSVQYGEVLLFSSHLIHGLAVNDEPDTTRVALEYRLFRKS
jgi:hypothetical protein